MFLKRPWAGSACHGGMRPVSIVSRIISDQPWSSAVSLISNGPISPALWHSVQCLLKIATTESA